MSVELRHPHWAIFVEFDVEKTSKVFGFKGPMTPIQSTGLIIESSNRLIGSYNQKLRSEQITMKWERNEGFAWLDGQKEVTGLIDVNDYDNIASWCNLESVKSGELTWRLNPIGDGLVFLSFSHRTSIVQKIGDPRKKVLIINFVAKSIPNNGQIVAREPRTRRVVVV